MEIEAELAQARYASEHQELEQAAQHYQLILQQAPGHVQASLELGGILELWGAHAEALKLYHKAYRHHPESPELFLRWQRLRIQQTLEDQLTQSPGELMKSLIEQAQRFPEAQSSLAQQAAALFEHHANIPEAKACLRLARDASQGVERFLLSLRACIISDLMPHTAEELQALHTELLQDLAQHERWAQTLCARDKFSLENVEHLLGSALYLARLGYFHLPLRPAREIMGRILAQCLPPLPQSDKESDKALAAAGDSTENNAREGLQKPRIAVVLNSNSAVEALLLPMLAYFPHTEAELHLLYTAPARLQSQLQQSCPQAVHLSLPEDLWRALEQIRALQCDALYLSEMYTDRPLQILCGSYRLAPLQFSSWLSSGTSGLEHVDLFLTQPLLESSSAEESYTEALCYLKHFPGMTERPEPVPCPPRSDYGLPEEGALYVCPQILFKLHPDFDWALLEILRRDPDGHVVVQQRPSSAQILRRFLARIESQSPELMPRLWVLPEMSRGDYLGLLQLADVILDPFYFGGGTTAFEALGLGVPMICWPTESMHGRFSAAFYRYIGIEETIAESPEQYVELAVQWARHPEGNGHLRKRILDAAAVLFVRAEIAESFWTRVLEALSWQRFSGQHGDKGEHSD